MTFQVDHAFFQGIQVLAVQLFDILTTVVLERANGCYQHASRWGEASFAALDVNELFSTQVGTEACLGHYIITKLERALGSDHGVATMCNVGERAAMHKRRIILEGLNQIRLKRIF